MISLIYHFDLLLFKTLSLLSPKYFLFKNTLLLINENLVFIYNIDFIGYFFKILNFVLLIFTLFASLVIIHLPKINYNSSFEDYMKVLE